MARRKFVQLSESTHDLVPRRSHVTTASAVEHLCRSGSMARSIDGIVAGESSGECQDGAKGGDRGIGRHWRSGIVLGAYGGIFGSVRSDDVYQLVTHP